MAKLILGRNIIPGGSCGFKSLLVLDSRRRIVAVDSGGFWLTEDDAKSWFEINAMENASGTDADSNIQTDYYILYRHPTDADRVFAVTARGLITSRTGGRGWTLLVNADPASYVWGGFDLSRQDDRRQALGRGSRHRGGGINNGGELWLTRDGWATYVQVPVVVNGDSEYGEDKYVQARRLAFHPNPGNPDQEILFVGFGVANGGGSKVTFTGGGIRKLTIDFSQTPPEVTARAVFESGSGFSGVSKSIEWLGFNYKASTPSQQLWCTMRCVKPGGDPPAPTTWNGAVIMCDAGVGTWADKSSGLQKVTGDNDQDARSQYTYPVFVSATEAYLGNDCNSAGDSRDTWGLWHSTNLTGSTTWARKTDPSGDFPDAPQMDDSSQPHRIWGDGGSNDAAHSRWIALALSPDSTTLYVAGNAELFRSVSLGGAKVQWRSEYSDYFDFAGLGSLVRGGPGGVRPRNFLATADRRTLIVATGDRYGAVSPDRGRNWRRCDWSAVDRGNGDTRGLAAHPTNASIIYGTVVTTGENKGGVVRSPDGGETWANYLGAPPALGDVACNDAVAFRTGQSTYLVVARHTGIVYTDDADLDLPTYSASSLPGTRSLIIRSLYRAPDGRLYCAAEKDQTTDGGIYRSTAVDSPATWEAIDLGASALKDALWVSGDPNDSQILYAGTHGTNAATSGIYRSTNANFEDAEDVSWSPFWGNGTPATNLSPLWETRATVDRMGRVYVCSTSAAKGTYSQGLGLWVYEPLITKWNRYALEIDGRGSQNFKFVYIDPFFNVYWLITEETGVYSMIWVGSRDP